MEGYEKLEFQFEGLNCVLMCPENVCEGRKWLYKTEYFEAFPSLDFDMLERGYFAAKYPQYVAAVYLDAPVMNYLSSLAVGLL